MSYQLEFIIKLNNAINPLGGKLYFVGGVVRDSMLNIPTKDIDIIVTKVEQEELENVLNKHLTVSFVGKSFGVYKCRSEGYEIDIALPRKEVSIGEGHRDFQIQQDSNITLEEDLFRRDFTINAMAIDISTGEIVDPYGGQKDLQEKLIRQLSENSIKEDYLRTLRAVQFIARFGFNIADQTLNNMKKENSLLETISGERVSVELRKFFKGSYLRNAVSYLKDINLLKDFLGDIPLSQWQFIENFNKNETFDEEIILSMYFHLLGNFNKAKKYLFLDKVTLRNTKAILSQIGKNPDNKTDIKIALSIIGQELFEKALLAGKYLGLTDELESERIKKFIAEIKENNEPYLLEHLAVKGNDLVMIGYSGKQIGDVLQKLLKEVIVTPARNNKEYLLSYFS